MGLGRPSSGCWASLQTSAKVHFLPFAAIRTIFHDPTEVAGTIANHPPIRHLAICSLCPASPGFAQLPQGHHAFVIPAQGLYARFLRLSMWSRASRIRIFAVT